MKIYIPTLCRADDQITWSNLPQRLRDHTKLVVDARDVPAYAKVFDSDKLLVCPPGCEGIGKVRQFICDQHDVQAHGPHVLMLDDDLTFFRRRTDDTTKFVPASPQGVLEAVDMVDRHLRLYAHVALRHREQAQAAPLVEENVRALRALAYHVGVLRRHNVRFDRLVVMEDFDVSLQLMRLGYPNAVLSHYIQNQRRSNAPGGCSVYRTSARQAEGARGLADLHPAFVRVVEKQTKHAWDGEARTDVVISWKKAYDSAAV